MTPQPRTKWRPSLAMIVLAVLLTVLALPAAVFLFLWPGSVPAERLVPAVAIVLAVTALVGFVFVRAITGPVQELTDRTARLTAGDRSAVQPLHQHGSREIADLSRGLLGMADALFDRSDYIANFATHVSHEIKTPLTSIRGAVELIMDQGDGMTVDERQKFLENILDDTWRITALLERLRQLAYADNPKSRGATTVGDVMRTIGNRHPELSVTLTGDVDRSIAMTQENAAIVLSNLVENSVQHGAREIVLNLATADGIVTLDFSDDGSGVSPGNEQHIFDLFFTTRRESGGTGMGLGIVRSMLKAHKGTITLHRAVQGVCFRLKVPAA